MQILDNIYLHLSCYYCNELFKLLSYFFQYNDKYSYCYKPALPYSSDMNIFNCFVSKFSLLVYFYHSHSVSLRGMICFYHKI